MLHSTQPAWLLLLLVVASSCQPTEAIRCDQEPPTAEGRLRKKLFCEFDQMQMPLSGAQPLEVSVRVQVKDLDVVSFGSTKTN